MKWFHSEKRWVRWSLRLGVVMIVVLFLVAWSGNASSSENWTRGDVGSTDEGIEHLGGVVVEVWQWPPPGSDGDCDVASDCWEWPWPLWSSEPPADRDAATSGEWCHPSMPICWPIFAYNWGFRDSFTHCMDGTEAPEIDPVPDWYRFRASKSGYFSSFYYEYHPDFDEACDIYDCDSDTDIPADCHTVESFDLRPFDPEQEHELKPDIMVDVRDLTDIEYDCMLTDDGQKVQAVTLRTATGWANVGDGFFEVERYYDGDDPRLRQWIETTDENSIEYDNFPDDIIEYHESHDHYHMQDWTELRILNDSVDCTADPDERPSWCEQTTGVKIGACVRDEEQFDDQIQTTHGSPTAQYTSCQGSVFGITPGWKDRYRNALDGQGIQLGTPSGYDNILEGTYLLEAEWDPNGTWEEYGAFRERNNTRAYIEVEIPEFTTAPSPECTWETDCTDWENLDGTDFSEGNGEEGEGWKKNRCRDHLRCDPGDGCGHLPGTWNCIDVPEETDKYCEPAN